MYRILIADDEEQIREMILKKIDWGAIGFSIAGSAENGLDALEQAERMHPDVVMTDIKMPFMDGLQLGEKLHETMPAVKLIIFSGFDEFEYAQQAIKMNAAEYILKPIDAAELTETLRKIKVQIDREVAEKRDVEMLKKRYEESLPAMREQFLTRLLTGRMPPEELAARAQQFGINLRAEGWAVALLRVDRKEKTAQVLKGETELVPILLKCTAEEELQAYFQFTDFLMEDCLVVIAEVNPVDGVLPLVNRMNLVCKSARRILGTKVMAGVSTVVASPVQLQQQYQEACSALDYSAVMGGDKAICIADVEPDTSARVEFDENDTQQIIDAVKLANQQEIADRIGAVFARFHSVVLPLGQYQVFLLEMITALLKVMHTYQIDDTEIFGQDNSVAEIIPQLHSPQDMQQWCTEICTKISTNVERKRVNSTRTLTQNAEQYIQKHYAEPEISVEELCGYLHVSPAYFSTVFKRESGSSFVSYLTDVRMKKAVELLNATNDKTYLIAQKVGYTEPNYFSYVFKKKYGVSPSKYRNQT
ncbi:MAG: response regulator [Oscillospiraceae bacterium]|nr:response regulator [Oscillospiraceae bacterium]